MKTEEINFATIRVLVVDDNPVDRLWLKSCLQGLGLHDIQEAESGNIAEYKINNAHSVSKPFDLLLIDWKMPEGDGLRLVKSVKSRLSGDKAGVFMVTAVAEMHKVNEAIQAGVDDFIIKPVERAMLDQKIKTFFRK